MSSDVMEVFSIDCYYLIFQFKIPGSSHEFTPDIFITVIAHTPFYISPAQQVFKFLNICVYENFKSVENKFTAF